ncbi:MAG: SDR family oxidoreductase [Syntrophomonas sp.]
MDKYRVLILGGSGMLGHKLYMRLSRQEQLDVYATFRQIDKVEWFFPPSLTSGLIGNIDANNFESIADVTERIKPDLLINCIGIIKQLPAASNHLMSIYINALLPHKLAELCRKNAARMLHISTDCVFSGSRGNYRESDDKDAADLYGRTKALGEVNYPHCLTLRTSIIGHEINTRYGLLEWFLASAGQVQGYRRHIYTGLTTTELSNFIIKHLIPKWSLHGIYHLSSQPISKYELLNCIKQIYKKQIEIKADDALFCDRSLDSSCLREIVNYTPPSWPEMLNNMYQDYLECPYKEAKRGDKNAAF